MIDSPERRDSPAPKDLGALDSCDEHRNDGGWGNVSPNFLLASGLLPLLLAQVAAGDDERFVVKSQSGYVAGCDVKAVEGFGIFAGVQEAYLKSRISPSNHQRTFIIGNGGSGKTWLAHKLAESLQLPVIHLDDLRWEPGHTGIARDNQRVANEVMKAGEAESWLMEGVYGWLASIVLDRATMLIWLDLPDDECISNARERGMQGYGSEESFQELIQWISEYRLRNNSSCFAAHSQLFQAFHGSKAILKSRDEIASYVNDVLGAFS